MVTKEILNNIIIWKFSKFFNKYQYIKSWSRIQNLSLFIFIELFKGKYNEYMISRKNYYVQKYSQKKKGFLGEKKKFLIQENFCIMHWNQNFLRVNKKFLAQRKFLFATQQCKIFFEPRNYYFCVVGAFHANYERT